MKKILVVDDEPEMVKILQIRLKVSGYEVIAAYDGEQGLSMARNESPDLIILDVMLPKLTGYQVCSTLKSDNKYKHIPIIMLTARAQYTDKDAAFESGADAYIVKPFEFKEFLAKVEEILNKA